MTFRVGDRLAASWELEAAAVTHWELQIDSRPLETVAATPHRYALPVLGAGDHLLRLRACTELECGEWGELAFALRPVVPGAPHHLRFVRSDELIDVPLAVTIVDAYVTIVAPVDAPLPPEKLQVLGARFQATGKTLTRGNLLEFLDEEYGKL